MSSSPLTDYRETAAQRGEHRAQYHSVLAPEMGLHLPMGTLSPVSCPPSLLSTE